MKFSFLFPLFLLYFQVSLCIRTVFVNSKAPTDEIGCMYGCEPESITAQINKPWPDSFSFCYRYNARSWTGVAPWLDLIQLGKKTADNKRLLEGILYGSYKSGPWIGFQIAETDTISWFALSTYVDKYPVLNWKHQCLLVDLKSGEMSIYIEAKLIFKEKFPDIIELAKKWTQNIEYVGVGSLRRSSDQGHMSAPIEFTDVQVYNRKLTQQQIQDFTFCKTVSGEIASWQRDNFVIESPRQYTTESEKDFQTQICGGRGKSFFHVPFRIVFTDEAEHYCSRFNAKVVQYTNQVEFDEVARNMSVAKYLRNSGECVEKSSETEYNFRFWLDARQTVENGPFKTSSGKEISTLPWVTGRPYGGIFHCLVMNLDFKLDGDDLTVLKSEIVDMKCDFADSCPTCVAHRSVPTLKVRGLCSRSKLDRVYSLFTEEKGDIIFLGEVNSQIRFDSVNKVWKWTDKRSPGEFATISKPYSSLLMGKAVADFTEMNEKCVENGDDKTIEITFSSCEDGFFTCRDGQCIDIESRCDQFSNCADGSDEQNCKSLIIKGNYNKKTSPFKLNRLTNEIAKAKINVSVIVIDLLQIVEVDLEFTCKFKMILEWVDHRLEFWNLKPQDSSNALSKDEEDKIWLPTLVFSNTEQNDITEGDGKSELIVARQTQARLSSMAEVEEINIYEGKDSILKFQRIYTKTFRCEYALHMYPFDTQVCTIDVEVRSLDQFGMELVPEYIEFAGKTVLTQYVVTKWSLEHVNPDNPDEGVHIKLTMRRRLFSEVMTTFLPTTLVLVIVYATNYFKDFFFETVVSVNLTALLVLTTLFVNVSSYLPKTAYLKMIDIWLLFAQFIPFFEVLLHTFMDSQRKTADKDGDEDDDKSVHTSSTTNGPSLINVKDVNGAVDNKPSGWNVALTGLIETNKISISDGLIARDEKEKLDNRKNFYNNADSGDDNRYLRIAEHIATKGTLIFFLIFALIYWTFGLGHYISNSS